MKPATYLPTHPGIPPSLDPFPRLGSRRKREGEKKKREKNKESIDRKFENFFRSNQLDA